VSQQHAIAAALVISLIPSCCFAWGAEGHRAIAEIAADELTDAAKQQVVKLLGGDDANVAMMDVSTWADEIRRRRPNSAPWHFVDIPIGSAGYDPRRDCQNDDCVVAQIERDEKIVGDRTTAPGERAEALRFLIHFVGDIHQPLHAADNGDRGGNKVRLLLRRHHTNLHAVWDVDVVRYLGRTPEEVASRLERKSTPAEQKEWQSGTPADWANESFQIANRDIYPAIHPGDFGDQIVLPPDFSARESSIVSKQIERAGVRLAWILNHILG
jgi:hypothetical protein